MNTKRIIALLIAGIMVLSMIPVMALSTSAAVEGDWTTYRFAGEYPSEDDEDDGEEKVYKPEAGYTYTSEGFQIVPADYKDTTPSMTVITKEAKNIKDGIYLQFRVDDYSYDGGIGADQWIALSLTTGEKVAPGSTKYGGGWLTLIRGAGTGNATSLPHLTDPMTEDFGGTFNNIGSAVISAPMDDDGREIYTFEVKHNGTEYEIYVNGVAQPGGAQTTALLDKLNSDGDFYVGINMTASVKDGTCALTILKFGTSEADATTPVGDDSKEPEENVMTIPDPLDPSTVEANMPAYLWNPENYANFKSGNNISFAVLGDNTWRGTATDTQVFFQFSAKRSWSYKAEDFPVFGIMVKNLWIDSGTLWYAAGDIMAPQNDCTYPFSIYDGEFYGEDEEYVFIPVDLSDMWEGRINCIRLDFSMADETTREFDICFAGMFRSEEEAYAYANSWLATNTEVETKDPNATEEPTEPVTEPVTQAPDQGDATQAPETNAPEGDTAQATETEATEEGCGSIIGFGAVAILAAAAAAVALKKD